MWNLAGTGLLYEPEKKVTIAAVFKYLEGDTVFIDEVRTTVMLK